MTSENPLSVSEKSRLHMLADMFEHAGDWTFEERHEVGLILPRLLAAQGTKLTPAQRDAVDEAANHIEALYAIEARPIVGGRSPVACKLRSAFPSEA